jgi:hypothetical protein
MLTYELKVIARSRKEFERFLKSVQRDAKRFKVKVKIELGGLEIGWRGK